jgi:hypothetical protein
LSEAHSDAHIIIDDLEARVKSAEACSIDVAADGKKRLMDFEDGVVRKLEELRSLYANSVQPSVACARKRLRRNPRLEITSAGCRKRYLVSLTCSVV